MDIIRRKPAVVGKTVPRPLERVRPRPEPQLRRLPTPVRFWDKLAPWRHLIGSVLLAVLAVSLFILTDLTGADIFFWLFLVALFFWNIDSRVSIGGALVCLVAIPLLLIAGQSFGFSSGEAWAEAVAVWAYYFLVIGVVKQIVEYKKENKNNPSEED